MPGSKLYDQMLKSGDYVYKDHLGLLYSSDYNRLAVHINSYLLENKFCPVQPFRFRIYKTIRLWLLRLARKYPHRFRRYTNSPFLIIFNETQMKLMALLDRLSKKRKSLS